MENLLLQAKGLYTFQNHLSGIPQGALTTAKNVVINRDGVIEPERGFAVFGNQIGTTTSNTANQLMEYQGRLLRHWGTSIDYDSDGLGTFNTFTITLNGDLISGNVTVNNIPTTSSLYVGMTVVGTGIQGNTVISSITNATTLVLSKTATATATNTLTYIFNISSTDTGIRLKSVQQNGNLYFTSSTGVRKLSTTTAAGLSSAVITDAGGIKALDSKVTLNTAPGWFTQESTVGYRVVWGINDVNSNLILGVPSERVVIYNPLTPLLIKDFNTLLKALDGVSGLSGYVSGYALTSNSTAGTLQTSLINVATKIDTDLNYKIQVDTGGITISAAAVTSGIASIKFSAGVSSAVSVGSILSISGFTGGQTVLNGTFTVTGLTNTSASNDTINFLVNSSDITGDTVAAGAHVYTIKYAGIAQPNISVNTNTNDLISLQTYYNTIITNLQNEGTGKIPVINQPIGNLATTSSTANVSFTVPHEITTAYFYQVYRTQLITSTGVTILSSLDPGDDPQLVYEANPTQAQINAGTISFQDITPSSFLGAYLYTNINTGEGILQSNSPPPLSKDVTAYKGYTFYSNTQTKHNLNLSMLAVSKFVSGTSTITMTDGTITHIYTFVSGKANVTNAIAVANTSHALDGAYFLLSSAGNATNYYVWLSDGNGAADPAVSGATSIKVTLVNNDSAATVAGKVIGAINTILDFSAAISTTSSTTVVITNTAYGPCTASAAGTSGFTCSTPISGDGESGASNQVLYTPSLSGTITAASIANPTVITSTAHGLFSGQKISITGSNSTPSINGVYVITKLTANTFTIPVNVTVAGTTATWNVYPIYTPSQQIDESARSLVRIVNLTAFDLLDALYISGSTDVPGLMQLESRRFGSAAFHLTVDNATTTGVEFFPALPASGATVISTNEVCPNRLYYSKYQQPEAVPYLNYIDVGPKNTNIRRILALRDSLFVLKDEGIYRLSGLVAPFVVSLFDSSAQIEATDSAVVLNNLIYMLSSQGVVTVSDTQVSVMSRPIEDTIAPIASSNFVNTDTATFGVSYEDDRTYYLYVPTLTTDTIATQCFKFNTFTNTWVQSVRSKTCGLVRTVDRKMYLGASDINYIEQERKNFDRTDHCDREYEKIIGPNSVSGTRVTIPSSVNVSVGDSYVQTQYLTIKQINQVLTKLDNDNGVAKVVVTSITTGATPTITAVNHNLTTGDTVILTNTNSAPNVNGKFIATTLTANTFTITPSSPVTVSGNSGFARYSYYNSILAIAGDDLGAVLTTLAGKLDTDPGLSLSNYSSLISGYTDSFSDQQAAFNVLTGNLNIDPGTVYKNYPASVGTIIYESPIVAIDNVSDVITLTNSYPVIQGTSSIYNHITYTVVYAPQMFQDVSMTKQVSEGTIIFEDSSFSTATLSYASDLSANFDDTTITGNGSGSFGNNTFGQGIFGGSGSGIPNRTYIPREKQRCRYLVCKFGHGIARETFSIYGVSLTWAPTSSRGYR